MNLPSLQKQLSLLANSISEIDRAIFLVTWQDGYPHKVAILPKSGKACFTKAIRVSTPFFLDKKFSEPLKGNVMTEEQTATANNQVVSEPNAETPQVAATAPPEQAEVATPEPTKAESPSPAAKSEPKEAQPQSSPEGPRFSSGVLFFLWVFCTLVFLSIAAGYIATR
ncbi:hypothetical protein [Acaryochloris sp. CCMEE 5410]|uniref:hypothetical protein n=1 Tax=Acaryochloris sp. CCMEE 5410 TaxID=310037 RepID=UPI0002483A8F|nr:hypothetical protein [Acaryochloris sp. CCMEE 5410]KAI9130905.1 hypothetical protein ON05_024650 [Acaryochloris sp. CCMEE 5410]